MLSLPIRTTPPHLILWDVIEEHLEEAGFELERWSSALRSPLYTLDDVAEGPEQYLLAHLSALLVAGPPAFERLLLPMLLEPEGQELSLLSAAAAIGLRLGHFDALFAALRSGPVAERRAIVRGLSLVDDPSFDGRIAAEWDRGRSAALSRVAILEVAGARGLPLAGFASALDGEDLLEVAAAVRIARCSRDRRVLPRLEQLTGHSDTDTRNSALDVAIAWGSVRAFRCCIELAKAHEPCSGHVLELVAVVGGPEEHALIRHWLEHDDAAVRHDAIRALGLTGDVANMEILLELLSAEDVLAAKLAGEAVVAIAGLDAGERAFQSAPVAPSPDEEARNALPSVEDDDLEADLRPDDAESLPLLDPAAVAQWWSTTQSRLSGGQRLWRGRRADKRTHLQLLREASMRARLPVATSLSIRTQGVQQLDVDALSSRQRRALLSLEDQPDLTSSNPLVRW